MMANLVWHFLEENWDRHHLSRFGAPGSLSYLMLTPRFRASRHVLFIVLSEQVPVLVAKVPRLAGTGEGLAREAANLRAVQALRPGGFDSIPRVVAFETYAGRPILVETALVGGPMDRRIARRDPQRCCGLMTGWLAEAGRPTAQAVAGDGAEQALERLVIRPLRELAELLPLAEEELRLLERTRELVAPLAATSWPLVFAHGDLSAPNVMLLEDGGPGVVDWELAEPEGLPASDVLFFLSYVAIARCNTRSTRAEVAAFSAAFFGPAAWARPHVLAYAQRVGLAEELLTPLFVACWASYGAGLVARLNGLLHREASPTRLPGDETAAWLRSNRYWAWWRYTLDHVHALDWRATASAGLAEAA